jgi:pimeloyl-ACP methyl ester carboxylesterase
VLNLANIILINFDHSTSVSSKRSLRVMATPNGTTPSGRTLKILMLHGFTQTGHLFEIKTKALKKALEKSLPPRPKPGHLKQYPGGIELHYPTAPIRLDVSDKPGFDFDASKEQPDAFGWWRRKGDAEPYVYVGMEQGLATIAQALQDQGPFDGVLGFSQGGAAAGMVASLLEEGRREAFEAAQEKGGMRFPDSFTTDSGFIEEVVHPPLKFAVSYSGFGASTNALYQAFYAPKIQTPMLHFLGTVDTVVSEERSLRLVDACVDGRGREGGVERVVYHPGGHFLPSSQRQYVAALVAFIREAIGESGESTDQEVEERVEDMDVPF